MRILRSCLWFLALVFALAACEPPSSAVYRAVALGQVAAVQAEAGDVAGARETAALALDAARRIAVTK